MSGKSQAGKIDSSGKTPNAFVAEENPDYECLSLSSLEELIPKRIELNLADLQEGDYAKFREIIVVKNGRPASALVLMNEPKILE